MKLHLSHGRPEDAVQAIQDSAIEQAEKSLESITDPEALLNLRKSLRSEQESLESHIKKQKARFTKSNKSRDSMLIQWKGFQLAVLEASRKHGIDFDTFPAHLTHGIGFIQKLQNIQPDSFATVEGLRIPQKRDESLLDDKKIELFEVQARQELLERIITRKHIAMKELFNSDVE